VVNSDAERLRSSFGSAALAYSQHRPDYARTAIDWALEAAPGCRVLDLGAGTGKLTGSLLERGCQVVAVEPDAAMLAELRVSHPEATSFQGNAEAIPVPDGSVDAVVAGNAMHWFEMRVAALEIARVLAPNGVIAGLWNLMDDEVGWVAQLAAVGGPEAIGPRDTPASWQTEAGRIHESMLITGAPFGLAECALFEHGQSRAVDSLVATFSTKAGFLVMPEIARQQRLEQIRQYLARRPETRAGEFVLPMVTGVMRTRRLSGCRRLRVREGRRRPSGPDRWVPVALVGSPWPG
jgi:SAM-dependent methyltransferase